MKPLKLVELYQPECALRESKSEANQQRPSSFAENEPRDSSDTIHLFISRLGT